MTTNDLAYTNDIHYSKTKSKSQSMDVIRPRNQSDGPLPVIVFLHGGGWAYGDKGDMRGSMELFARRGFFCASINYRLTSEAIFPAQIHDCKCAMRFLRAKAGEFNIDPDAIGTWGESAGGHLAALLGCSSGEEALEGEEGWEGYESDVQAVVDFFGPTDITRMGHLPEAGPFVGGLEENSKNAVAASPIQYVSEDCPPFLMIHGTEDELVPYDQSTTLEQALREYGVEVEILTIHGGGHGGAGFEKAEIRRKIERFYDRVLKGMD